MQIFKKKDPKISFKDMRNFEAATLDEIREAAKDSNSWTEVTNRLNSLNRFQQKLVAKAGETPEELMRRRHDLEEKAQILRNRRNEIEQAQKKAKADADNKFAADSWKQEYPNLRYSADTTVSRMHHFGLAQVPISAVPWKKIDDKSKGVVEIVTASGRTVKVDFTRLNAQHWRLLKEQRYSPLLIGVENSHIVRDGKKEGIMLDEKFHAHERIVLQQTWLAIMLT